MAGLQKQPTKNPSKSVFFSSPPSLPPAGLADLARPLALPRASIRAARLQAVLENHSMSLADIFEGDSSTVLAGSKDVTNYLGHLQDGVLTQSDSGAARAPAPPDVAGRAAEIGGYAGMVGGAAPRSSASPAIATSMVAQEQETPRPRGAFGGADDGFEAQMELKEGGEQDRSEIADNRDELSHRQTQGTVGAGSSSFNSTVTTTPQTPSVSASGCPWPGEGGGQEGGHHSPTSAVSGLSAGHNNRKQETSKADESDEIGTMLPPHVQGKTDAGPTVGHVGTSSSPVTHSPLLGGGGHEPGEGGDGREREPPTAAHGNPHIDGSNVDGLGSMNASHEARTLPGGGYKRFGDSSTAPINNTTTTSGENMSGYSHEAAAAEGVDDSNAGGPTKHRRSVSAACVERGPAPLLRSASGAWKTSSDEDNDPDVVSSSLSAHLSAAPLMSRGGAESDQASTPQDPSVRPASATAAVGLRPGETTKRSSGHQQRHQLSAEGGSSGCRTSQAVPESSQSSPQTAYIGQADNHEVVARGPGEGTGEGHDAALETVTPSELEYNGLGAAGAGEREDVGDARNEDSRGSGASAIPTDADELVAEGRSARIDSKAAVEAEHSAEAASIAAGREELATAVALKIVDADGTRYGEALVEVQDALMGTFGDTEASNRTTTAAVAPRDGDAMSRDVRRSV